MLNDGLKVKATGWIGSLGLKLRVTIIKPPVVRSRGGRWQLGSSEYVEERIIQLRQLIRELFTTSQTVDFGKANAGPCQVALEDVLLAIDYWLAQ